MGKWGPVPPLKVTVLEVDEAVRALHHLIFNARCHLGGEPPFGLSKEDWLPYLSSREDFEHARAEFHQRIDESLLMGGQSYYLRYLADEIDILEGRKERKGHFPRCTRLMTVIDKCFARLWEHGENWVTRTELFGLVCAELKDQSDRSPTVISSESSKPWR
jgi:hypothetical protein